MLMQRYQKAVDDLFAKIRNTQTKNIIEAADIIANAVMNGGKIYMYRICHGIEKDLLYRGGGPIFYKHFEEDLKKDMSKLTDKDVLIVSSVSGRTKEIVDYTWEAVNKGTKVIAFTSMEYAVVVDPVHESGKKLYEMATLTIDNCAPAAEAMLHVDGIEAPFAASSGIASDYIMWCITCNVVEKMLEKGYTPGILKSANFPGGNDYNKTVIEPHYEKYGW